MSHRLLTQTAGAFLGFCCLKQLGVNRSYLFKNGGGQRQLRVKFLVQGTNALFRSSTLTLRSEGLYDPLPNTAAPPLVSKFTNNYCDYLLTNEQIFWWLILAFITLLVFTLNVSVDAGKTLNARKGRGSSLQFLLLQRHPKESNQRPLKQSKCSIDSIHTCSTQLHNQCKLLCVVVKRCPMVSPFLKPFLEIKYKQNPNQTILKYCSMLYLC